MCEQGVWAACPCVDGVTAADWMAEYGRFPPQVALHIAREMVARLSDVVTLGAMHGDVSAAGLVIEHSGHVALPMPGMRPIVRPAEGYGFDDLPVEGYDYLAPERIADGGPPTLANDIYACGCVWWHLLTGRAPFPGGNSLTKLKAVHAAKLVDVRQLAADVPEVLVRAIERCTERDASQRPASIDELQALLGPPARGGAAILSRCLTGQAWLWQPARAGRTTRRAPRKRQMAVAAALLMTCMTGVAVWQSRRGKQPTGAIASAPASTSSERPADATRNSSTSDQVKMPPPPRPIATHNATLDPQVKPTAAVEPLDAALIGDLVLPAGRPVKARDLALQTGQRVRSAAGKRAVVDVSEGGLLVSCDAVCFDGVDFVWYAGTAKEHRANPDSMLTIAAQGVEFRGCSFSTPADRPPIAVTWSAAAESSDDGGELTFTDCVFRGVQAVVDCRGSTSLAVALTNTLCVAAGPIVRLHAPPGAGKSVALSLEHVTTRGDCAVLECRYREVNDELGAIVVTVTDSALVTNPQGALLILAGPQRPELLLRAFSWNGQGSLVTDDTAVAEWRDSTGRERAMAEDELEIAGLVRSSVSFAGAAHEPPAASRITRWNAPLQSDSPPGCDTSALYLPEN